VVVVEVMMLVHSQLWEIQVVLVAVILVVHSPVEVLMQEHLVKEIPVVLEHLEEILVELVVEEVVLEVLVIMLLLLEIIPVVLVVLVVNFLQHSKIQRHE
jgi:hypothetical protein